MMPNYNILIYSQKKYLNFIGIIILSNDIKFLILFLFSFIRINKISYDNFITYLKSILFIIFMSKFCFLNNLTD